MEFIRTFRHMYVVGPVVIVAVANQTNVSHADDCRVKIVKKEFQNIVLEDFVYHLTFVIDPERTRKNYTIRCDSWTKIIHVCFSLCVSHVHTIKHRILDNTSSSSDRHNF